MPGKNDIANALLRKAHPPKQACVAWPLSDADKQARDWFIEATQALRGNPSTGLP